MPLDMIFIEPAALHLHQQMACKSVFKKNIGSASVYNDLSPDECQTGFDEQVRASSNGRFHVLFEHNRHERNAPDDMCQSVVPDVNPLRLQLVFATTHLHPGRY